MLNAREDRAQTSSIYWDVLVRQWKIILGITLLAVLAAAILTPLVARVAATYEAQAHVALTGAKYQLTLDPNFKTVDVLSDSESQLAVLAARSEEFRTVALSPEVRRDAMKRLMGTSSAEPLPEMGGIDVKTNKGGLLTISATAETSAEAVQRANVYAEAVVDRVNHVYGQSSEVRVILVAEVDRARSTYQQAEAAYLVELQNSDIERLNREIAFKESYTGQLEEISQNQRLLLVNQLKASQATVSQIDQLIRDARALRQQVQTSGQAPASLAAQSLSLLSLQSRLVSLGSPLSPQQTSEAESGPVVTVDKEGKTIVTAGERGRTSPFDSRNATEPLLPAQVQINGDSLLARNAGSESMIEDLDALLSNAQGRRAEFVALSEETSGRLTQNQTEFQSDSAQAEFDQALNQLSAEIAVLQAQLRERTTKRELLSQDVEQAKETLNTLVTKLREIEVAGQATGRVATIAARASEQSQRTFPPPLSRSVPLAALAGLLIGLFAAFALELWARRLLVKGARPALVRQPIGGD